MSYIINLTNGTVYATIQDGTTNTSSGLTLIGRNYVNYGGIQNENFVKLLENFADTIPPTTSSLALAPLVGTLWYDTGNNLLKVYDGSQFNPVSQQIVNPTAPTAKNIGDQWWDTTNQQLNVWSGTTWILIGPSHTSSQGISGPQVETIVDSKGASHTVVKDYVNGSVVSIISYDPEFAPGGTVVGFGNIKPGINLASGTILNGTANNSLLVGNVSSSSFARVDQASAFTKDVSVAGNFVLTLANIWFSSQNLNIQNRSTNGNVSLYVNSGTLGNIQALSISGTNGLVSVYANPTSPLHVATKNYVDTNLGITNATVINNYNVLSSEISALQNDLNNTINLVSSDSNANLVAAINLVNSNVSALTLSTTSNSTAANNNIATLQSQVSGINNYLTFVANINSPTFTGIPQVPNAAPNSNSAQIASTAYVDVSAGVLSTDYNAKFTNEVAARNAAITAAVTPLANVASPTFTGVPKAPTATAGDNSTQIATTAFVTGAIAVQQFHYTVSTTPPTGGNPGDFWFQIS
jgi:hypothetical protein